VRIGEPELERQKARRSPVELCEAWHRGAVGGAASLAFATVFAGAAVITGFASALAFTVILAFTGVLGGVEVRTAVAQTGPHDLGGVCGDGVLRGRVGGNGASAGQTGQCGREEHCIQLVFHKVFNLILEWRGFAPRVWGRQDDPYVHPAEFGGTQPWSACAWKGYRENRAAE
jgi:hypothetical protein